MFLLLLIAPKQKNFASRKIGSLCGGGRKPAPALLLRTKPPPRRAVRKGGGRSVVRGQAWASLLGSSSSRRRAASVGKSGLGGSSTQPCSRAWALPLWGSIEPD